MEINKEIKRLVEKLGNGIKSGLDIVNLCEQSFLPNLSKEDKEQYNRYKEVFIKLKQEIESRANEPLIAEKIKIVKKSGQDRFLTNKEERLKRNIMLVLEREILIVRVFQKILNNEVKLSNIQKDFDKYNLLNFYRTFCELSIRLFADNLLAILEFEIRYYKSKNEPMDKINSLEKTFKEVLDDSIGLDDMKSILARFDKHLQERLELSKLMDEVFLYEEGEGFTLRNWAAHEKILFSEIDHKDLFDELNKIPLSKLY